MDLLLKNVTLIDGWARSRSSATNADVVLVQGDPLQGVAALGSIFAVVKDGIVAKEPGGP